MRGHGKNTTTQRFSCLLPRQRFPFLLGNVSGVKTLKPPSRNRKIEWEGSGSKDLQFVARPVASAQVRKKRAS